MYAFDFRGHGRSSGRFAWTAAESRDLAAVVAHARRRQYFNIGVIGFSLGAAVAIIEASRNRAIKSVIAVSAPYDFWRINVHFWEPEMLADLRLNLGPKGKGKFIRPGSLLTKKIKPIDVVADIAPTPVCFIHGGRDWLIKPTHSQVLFEQAQEPKKIIVMERCGHAEKIYDNNPRQFMAESQRWFDATLAA